MASFSVAFHAVTNFATEATVMWSAGASLVLFWVNSTHLNVIKDALLSF